MAKLYASWKARPHWYKFLALLHVSLIGELCQVYPQPATSPASPITSYWAVSKTTFYSLLEYAFDYSSDRNGLVWSGLDPQTRPDQLLT
jgi:hypothetical protein